MLLQHQSTCRTGHPREHDAAAQVSYMILQRVSPVTHSIGNCLKRVIVIVASVIVFQNPMSRQNMIGAGRILYRRDPASHTTLAHARCRGVVNVLCVVRVVLKQGIRRFAGTAVALAGVFAYSQVKRLSGKKKAA